jgi:hypothetical protein
MQNCNKSSIFLSGICNFAEKRLHQTPRVNIYRDYHRVIIFGHPGNFYRDLLLGLKRPGLVRGDGYP